MYSKETLKKFLTRLGLASEQPLFASATWSIRIAVVSVADGRELKAFSSRLINAWSSVQWTPDGRGLSYIAPRDGMTNIWVQPFDGGEPRQITDSGTDATVNVAWSPDGKVLACTRVAASSSVVTITGFR